MSDTRLVPMTHGDVSWLHTSEDTPQRREALMRLNIGFNSAPANPAEAVHEAVEAATREWAGMPWDGCGIPTEMQEGALVGMVRDAALAALGFDREPPA